MTASEIIESKIFKDAQSFISVLNQWKQSGETVVFTNGCFDLVHRGHIDSLAKAADLGTKLIVCKNPERREPTID